MCKPYSQDLCERVSDGRFGRCAYKAVPLFRVSVSYIYIIGRPVAGARPGTQRHVTRRAGAQSET